MHMSSKNYEGSDFSFDWNLLTISYYSRVSYPRRSGPLGKSNHLKPIYHNSVELKSYPVHEGCIAACFPSFLAELVRSCKYKLQTLTSIWNQERFFIHHFKEQNACANLWFRWWRGVDNLELTNKFHKVALISSAWGLHCCLLLLLQTGYVVANANCRLRKAFEIDSASSFKRFKAKVAYAELLMLTKSEWL